MISDMDKHIEALLVERAGYEMRGLKDRVKACDEQLRALGHSVKTPEIETAIIEPLAERAVRKAASKRKA